jgi:thiol-disulfide isomerase/thioredoxin
MDERLLLAIAIALAGLAVYLGVKLAHRARLSRRDPDLPEGWRSGVPGVLYFASQTCSPCRAQGAAVEKLGEQLGRPLNLVEVDVDDQQELTEKWSVVTVPTTVVLDGDGTVRTINHGVASEEKLRRQLEGVA